MSAIKRCSSISSILWYDRKISKFSKIALVIQDGAKIRNHKNGGIESNDQRTGAIPKYGLDVKMIEIMLDGCQNEDIF